MQRLHLVCLVFLFTLATPVPSLLQADPPQADERPVGLTNRTLWTTSQFQGSPDPPLPYKAQDAFPELHFNKPTVVTSAPGVSRLFVAEHQGKVFSFPNDPACKEADLLVDVKDLVAQMNANLSEEEQVRFVAVYGLTFHPQFAENGYAYLCYVVRYASKKEQRPGGTRVVRLKVEGDPPKAIIESETEIISWLQGGHNGGCLKFGLDGNLFVSAGDGGFAYPPDGRKSGQDVSNLLSAVARIDVDHPTDERPYSIPKDNPLINVPGARPEIWAYGMRNPWKMSIDRKTGDLWVGDVGWQLWELVYRVKPGDNYGWSLVEGPQPVHTEDERGPTPITPAAHVVPHTDGASITGGFVYRGEKFPELQGRYLFGDWETRRIWTLDADAAEVGERIEIVEPTVRIVGFAELHNGELLLLDHDSGAILELVRNEQPKNAEPFPVKLSESGLFASVENHRTAPGVLPFSINAEMWADSAQAERFVGLPGDTAIGMHVKAKQVPGSMFSRVFDFPTNSVLAKTLSLELEQGNPKSRKRIETQILHFNGYDWKGYSYRWNDEQTDAELVGAQGETITLQVKDAASPGGQRSQQWRFSSRIECIRCHNPWAESALGFNTPQINRDHDYGGAVDNQLRTLRHIGVIKNIVEPVNPEDPFKLIEQHVSAEALPALANPFDATAAMEDRGRAYLHANCAHCHREHGGGSARIHIAYDTPLSKSEAVGTRPSQGAFGILNAEILAPGDPYKSVLYYRMAKEGPGHMPHLGARLIDRPGLQVVHDWIRQLPVRLEMRDKIDSLITLDESAVLATEKEDRERTVAQIAFNLAKAAEREAANKKDKAQAAEQAAKEAAARVVSRASRRTTLITEVLADPPGAMMLARALREKQLPPATAQAVLELSKANADLAIRDLYEPFLPEDQKVKRLGETINAAALLAVQGDAKRGRDLFLTGQGIQCRSCHRVGEQGVALGPDLSQIGKRLDRAKLLESILEPSKTIDPKFRTWLVETVSGKVVAGLLIERTDEAIVIRDPQNKEHRFTPAEVEDLFPQRKSMMPDLLLRDMSAEQVADLLAWLESLK